MKFESLRFSIAGNTFGGVPARQTGKCQEYLQYFYLCVRAGLDHVIWGYPTIVPARYSYFWIYIKVKVHPKLLIS